MCRLAGRSCGSVDSRRPVKQSVRPVTSTSPPAPESYPVLVVEDDPAIRLMVARTLGAQGYAVTAVGSSEEGLAKLAGISNPIVVTDLRLPGLDGFALVRQLRDRGDDFEAVMMTAHADVEGMALGMHLSVFACLRKPFDLHELVAAVAGAANRLFLRLDRRRRAEELEQRNLELEQALERLKESETRRLLSERLASVGRFAAALNHELNNPLAYVHANVALLAEGAATLRRAIDAWVGGARWIDLDPELREESARYAWDLGEMLKETLGGLDLMRQISNDLGSVSRYRRDAIAAFDLNEVVRSACRIACVEPRLRHALSLHLAEGELRVHGNAGRMAQVVMNLVANAAAAADAERENHVRVSTGRAGVWVTLEVSDTGVGIPSERLARIFEPFATFRQDGSGTGLGLAVVQEIVEEHEGSIEVSSDVGRGSRFRVSLPALHQSSPAPPSSGIAPAPARRLRILVVDDDPALRRVIGRALGRRHQVALADGAAQALALIRCERPDVIVTDLMMPEMDGLGLFERIRAEWPTLAERVVLISGTHSLMREAARRAPALPLLRKPFTIDDLERAVLAVA
jgi:signal transduction histidine kinase